MPILIETDILLALISPEDKHHTETTRLLDKILGDSRLSPYSLIELDLLLRSGEIVVREVKTFYTTLSNLFKYREISLLPAKPINHGEAYELRRKYKELTYFDSLHAAVGIAENLELVSYDKEYAKITELEYNHPNKHI
ncbi:PIN domain-containing protein [Candidatus Bathyarchaeota archaeon]|nr:MAG: PIN domain-containing protein [Candidatus Bathyarchaeota archaeon]